MIFGSALTTDGESKPFVLTRRASVWGPARLGNNNTRAGFSDAISRRRSCQVTKDGFIYHGLLYSNGKCEFDLRTLEDQIRISTTVEHVSVTLDNCTTTTEEKSANLTIEYLRCPNALVSCDYSKGEYHASWCAGTLQTEDGEYVCTSFKSRRGNKWTADCHRSKNTHRVGDSWLYRWKVSGSNVVAAIGAVSVLGQETKEVKYVEYRNVTNVSNVWFAMLGLKTAVVFGLAFMSFVLLRRGALCVLNDEHELAHLLRRTLTRGLSDEQFSIYLHHKKTGTKNRFWASENPQMKDQNLEIHKEESKFH